MDAVIADRAWFPLSDATTDTDLSNLPVTLISLRSTKFRSILGEASQRATSITEPLGRTHFKLRSMPLWTPAASNAWSMPFPFVAFVIIEGMSLSRGFAVMVAPCCEATSSLKAAGSETTIIELGSMALLYIIKGLGANIEGWTDLRTFRRKRPI